MSNLSFGEKHKLEKLLGMGGGYVLEFSNRTFQEFVFDSTGRNIFDEKYNSGSGSKANRLRAFWRKEPNHIVGKLLGDLLNHCKGGHSDSALYEDCHRTMQRLVQDSSVQHIEAISPNSAERDFNVLARTVKEAIEKNEPESGLDRLHTFVVKYVRVLCKKHRISTDRDKPLHSLLGEYIKALKNSGMIESEMTERILKSSISILEAFNHIRNDRSLAHDNPVLNYNESLLIFSHVASSIRFIHALEDSDDGKASTQGKEADKDDEISF
jgi:hypothetical protein